MSPPAAVTLSMILLRLLQVFNLDTCFIRNALAVSPLAAGVAAVDRIRPLGSKGFSTCLTNPVLPFFQAPLFQIFLITPVAAQVIIAIFLGADLRVKNPPAPFAIMSCFLYDIISKLVYNHDSVLFRNAPYANKETNKVRASARQLSSALLIFSLL